MHERWLNIENKQSEQAIAGGACNPKWVHRWNHAWVAARRLHGFSRVLPQEKSESVYETTSNGEKTVPGTVPVMDANSVSPSLVYVLSMHHFVRSLRVDGTGYADTWLKELGSYEKGMRG